MKILFVCTGNICRSPTAEAILRTRAAALGLAIETQSAGTHGYHIGDPPDSRTIQMAAYKGVDMAGQRARQVSLADYADFDLILAMDRGHYDRLIRDCPESSRGKIRLFLEESGLSPERGFDVPDPYYGGLEGFEQVYLLIEQGVEALLAAHNPLKINKKE